MTAQRTGHGATLQYGATAGGLTSLVCRRIDLHTETVSVPLIDPLDESQFERLASYGDWVRSTPWSAVVLFDTSLGLPALQRWNVVRVDWPLYTGESTAARLQGAAWLIGRTYPVMVTGSIMQSVLQWKWDQWGSGQVNQLTFTAAT